MIEFAKMAISPRFLAIRLNYVGKRDFSGHFYQSLFLPATLVVCDASMNSLMILFYFYAKSTSTIPSFLCESYGSGRHRVTD